MNTKRPVGRPRNPKPDWWPKGSAATNEFFESLGVPPNITDETHNEYKKYADENRREQVGHGVREAYRQGRNTANGNRKSVALKRLTRALALEENAPLIANSYLTPNCAVKRMEKNGTTCGAGRNALRKGIAAERQKLSQAKLR